MANFAHLTGWLAIALGLYALAAGLGMALGTMRFDRLLQEVERSPALSFVIGLLTFLVGITIVLIHPWGGGWLAVLVSLIGWATLAEGLLLLAAPRVLWAYARPMMAAAGRLWGWLAVLIGIGFLAAGWCHI